jgi:hypothetical protein
MVIDQYLASYRRLFAIYADLLAKHCKLVYSRTAETVLAGLLSL